MHHQSLNYANKENDSLMEINNSFPHQTTTPVGQNGHNMFDYGTMNSMMMDASYYGAESMDLQSTFGSMTLFPSNQVESSQQPSMAQQHTTSQEQHQQPALEQFGSNSHITANTMHITSAPVVKSQASLVKNEDLWSPPANYHVPSTPLPTGVIQSWPPIGNGNSNNKNSDQIITSQQQQQQQQQQLKPQQQHENSDPTPSHWYQSSSFSPSYQDMMLSDVCPTPSPVHAPPVSSHYGSPEQQEDSKPQVTTTKKVNAVRRTLPRRHTVSTVYNSPLDHIHNSNAILSQHQQKPQQQQQLYQQQSYQHQPNPPHQDVNQQAKMRKMLKARRHRSLGRLEVPSHYLTKVDTGYHAASPTSLSCGTSRCGSPLSAECVPNEQLLDRVMVSLDQHAYTLSHPPYQQQQQQQQQNQHMSDEIDSDVSSYPSFLVQPIYQTSPPLPTTNALPPAPIVQSQQQQQQHHHHHHHYRQQPHLQMMEDELYSMATTSHTPTNTAPTSPVLIPMIDDESEPDEIGERISHQEPEGPHICQWADCRLEFQLLDHLIDHTKGLHIGSGKPLYYCRWKDCSRGEKPFTKRHKMHNHLRTHTKERPYVCMEEGCGKRFARPDSMATHTKIHTNIRPYACQHENCDKAYYHLRSLRKHEKSHEIPPPLPTPSLMDHHLSVLELKD